MLLFRRIVAIYFRRVEVAGELPTRNTGGRLFAANHVNALVDPILVLTQAPCVISPVAKSTLWKIPGLRWLLDAADAVPIVRRRDNPTKTDKDNEAVFERVASHLGRGGNILIFPEGTSHNEPHLLALRSGAGRMLGKSREEGVRNLTFQAVALEFDARDVFRSRSLVLFGPARNVDDLADAPDVAQAITEKLASDLAELLVEGTTWDERMLIVRVAELFANEGDDRTLEGHNRIGRRIEEARCKLTKTDPSTLGALETNVRAYFYALDDALLHDRDVVRFAKKHAGAPARPRSSRLLLLGGLPLAVVGMVLYWLPYQLPRLVTRKLQGDPDVASTYKLGVGLLVFPIWAALLLVAAGKLLGGTALAVAVAIVVTTPFAALPWLDRLDRFAASFRSFASLRNRTTELSALAEQRTRVLADLEAARVRAEGV